MKIEHVDDKVLSYEIVIHGIEFYYKRHDGELRELRPYLSHNEKSYYSLIYEDKDLTDILQGEYDG